MGLLIGENKKDNILNLLRHLSWIAVGIISALMLGPAIAEIKTFLLILLAECTAIGLSGLAVYAYTKIDFTKRYVGSNLGLIFIGVHVCTGLVVLGVYLAQIAP